MTITINKKKLVQRLKNYASQIDYDAAKYQDFNFKVESFDKKNVLKHAKYMIETTIENIHSWPDHRLNRWLGFIQGVMWSQGLNTLNDFRDDIRDILDHDREHQSN